MMPMAKAAATQLLKHDNTRGIVCDGARTAVCGVRYARQTFVMLYIYLHSRFN